MAAHGIPGTGFGMRAPRQAGAGRADRRKRERLRVAPKVDPDLLEDSHRRLMNGLLRIAVEERIGGNAVDRWMMASTPRAGWRGLADTAATPDDGCRRGGGDTADGL